MLLATREFPDPRLCFAPEVEANTCVISPWIYFLQAENLARAMRGMIVRPFRAVNHDHGYRKHACLWLSNDHALTRLLRMHGKGATMIVERLGDCKHRISHLSPPPLAFQSHHDSRRDIPMCRVLTAWSRACKSRELLPCYEERSSPGFTRFGDGIGDREARACPARSGNLSPVRES